MCIKLDALRHRAGWRRRSNHAQPCQSRGYDTDELGYVRISPPSLSQRYLREIKYEAAMKPAYPPLNARTETRLLNLHYGAGAEALSCETHSYSLENPPPYDALSYARNDAVTIDTPELPIKTEIKCNDEVLNITPNLGRALQYLRLDRAENSTRPLWIDKTCINENDFGEREAQVKLMGKIFGKAECVIVWLGDSDKTTAALWELMANLRRALHNPYSPIYNLGPGWKSDGITSALNDQYLRRPGFLTPPSEFGGLPPAEHKSWNLMKAFLRRAWFGRVWTLQEVVVSKNCQIRCGEHKLSWECLCQSAAALHRADYTRFWGPENASIITRESERQRWHSEERSPLRSLLSLTRTLKTTDPHDKVFGLLPLAKKIYSFKLNVEYSRSTEDIFTDIARTCIKEEQNLAVLAETEIRTSRPSKLASWVPDWREPASTPISLNAWSADHKLFHSAKMTEPWVLTAQSPDTLKLSGFAVARISRVLPVDACLKLKDVKDGPNELEKSRWRPADWQEIYANAASVLELPSSVIQKVEHSDDLSSVNPWTKEQADLSQAEKLKVALRRTLTADLYPRPKGRLPEHAIKENFPRYYKWQQGDFDAMSGKTPKEVLWEHDWQVKYTMQSRSAFIASDDSRAYLGIGLETLREGDWICVLYGGHTPFILRPLHGTRGKQPHEIEEWSFVSECYVHGLMDGEAMALKSKDKYFVLPPAKSSGFHSSKL